MVHPLAVYTLEQADTLQLTHQGCAVALLLVVQDVHAALIQHIRDALLRDAVVVSDSIVEVGVGGQPAQIVAAERTEVPLVLHIACEELLAAGLDVLLQHIVHLGADVLAVQDLAALTIDDLALLVHDVVVFQDVLADLEVPALELLLGRLDGAGDHPVLDGGVLVDAQRTHQALHAVAAEQTHQIVLEAQIEAGCTGVALTACTAAQLVVDTAALVTLSTDDEQTASSAHLFSFRFGQGLVLSIQLLEPLADSQNVGVGSLTMAVGLDEQQLHGCGQSLLGLFRVQQLLAEVLFAHLGLCHILGVAAQHNIGTTASHVGGDGDGPLLTGLCDDLCLTLVVLCVQHIEIAGVLLQHLGESLALIDADSTHQDRLAVLVALHDLLDDGIVFAVDGLVDGIRVILADDRAVGGDGNDVQTVDLSELGGLRLCRTGHTGQLLIHTEVVLEGDGRQRLALGGDLHALLGLDGLMEALVVTAADHQATGKLIDDEHFAVLHDVINVALHHTVGFDGLVDVVGEGHILCGSEVLDLEIFLGLLDALSRQGAGLVLLVHDVIAVSLLVGLHLVFQLDHDALAQSADEAVHLGIQAGRVLSAARDDKRRTGLVDEDGVHLIDNGVGMAALHHVVFISHHVVAQIVEAELVVGAVGNVGIISFPAGIAIHALHDQAHRQAQPAVKLAHPLAVALGKVIVDGDDVDTLAGQCIQIGGQRCHKGLAFTGLHLGDVAPVQGDAAGDLHREMLHAQHTPCGLAADSEGIGQNIIQRFAIGQLLLQCRSLGLQLGIRHRLILAFQSQHLFGEGVDLFQLPVGEATKEFFS